MAKLQQNYERFMITPPGKCTVAPSSYTQFFNDSKTLPGIAPYTLRKVNDYEIGNDKFKLEYNNFYSNWKTDSLKWYGNGNRNGNSTGNGSDIEYKPNLHHPTSMNPEQNKLYLETKRHEPFATPLPTNGTNQINIINNPKCHINTFNYKRYASQPINNKSWFYNPLYITDISTETQDMKADFIDNTIQNNMDIYSSVFQDMYSMTNEDYYPRDNK